MFPITQPRKPLLKVRCLQLVTISFSWQAEEHKTLNTEAHILLHLSTSLRYKMHSVISLKAPQIYREHPAHQLSLSGWAQLSSLYPLPLGSFINQARDKAGDHLHQFGCLTERGRQQQDRSGFIFQSLESFLTLLPSLQQSDWLQFCVSIF